MSTHMAPTDWLRAVAVWSPFPSVGYELAFTPEECIAAIGRVLEDCFPSEVFCEATVRLMARRCETFPNYYWCNKVLREWMA